MYFDVNPDAAHDIHDLAVVLLGQKMNFYTDAGVFSKKMIDYGSQVLLSTLDFQEGESVLDVGCGYGPIGLSLAKAQGVAVTMVDVNERALDLAQKNASRNGVEAQIFSSDVYEAVEGVFDHVISNPPIRAGKKVVHQVITGSFEHWNQVEIWPLSFKKNKELPALRPRSEETFGNCETVKKDKGYYIFKSEKESWEQ